MTNTDNDEQYYQPTYLFSMRSPQPVTNCGFLVTHMAARSKNKPNTQASGHLYHKHIYC